MSEAFGSTLLQHPFAPMLVLGGVLFLAYVKTSVVLAVLRRGLGGIPPAALTAVLALFLSGLAMAPLFERCQKAMLREAPKAPIAVRLQAGMAPLREFLLQHTQKREQAAVQELVQHLHGPANSATVPAPAEASLDALLFAFVLSELRIAFQIGFILLLPFLLIDILCASLLSGLLLPGLPARAVALPFKLLLFVMCDGWHLLSRGLLLAYGAMSGGST